MQKKTGKEKIQIVNDMSLNKNKILELIIDVTEFEIEKLKDKRNKVYSDKKKKEGKKERKKYQSLKIK